MVKQITTNREEYNNNYVAIVPMTFEERYRMYMRCKKEELAKMLAQRDEYELLLRQPCYPQPCQPYPQPITDPMHPFAPWVTYATNDEQTSISD